MTQTRTQNQFPWEIRFSAELKQRRVDADLSLYALARALSERGLPFHQQQLDRIERGERAVRLNEAIVIASYFGLTLEAMTGAGGEEVPASELDLLLANVKDVVVAITEHHADATRAWLSIVGLRKRVEASVGAVATYASRAPSELGAEAAASEAALTMTSALEHALEVAIRTSSEAVREARSRSSILDGWLPE